MKTEYQTIISLIILIVIAPAFVLAQGPSTSVAVQGSSTVTQVTTAPPVPERPAQRSGESSASYAARLRAWETEADRIAAAREKAALTQELQRLTVLPRSTGRVTTSGLTSDNILVIPTAEIKAENLININEDMNVMSQIFKNELSIKGVISSSYGPMPWNNSYGTLTVTGFSTGRNSIISNSIYLQGYGALFLMEVDFPLSAPPEKQEQTQEPNEGEADQVWQQTKQQIYEPQVSSTGGKISTRTAQLQMKYDAQKVDNLKTTLITALKHASNIRALKPDESVTLRVTGPGVSITVVAVTQQEKQTLITYEANGVRHTTSSVDYPDFLKSIAAPTAIVIRAKKSDIDAFAQGKLSLDKFRDIVEVFSYPLLSRNSVN